MTLIKTSALNALAVVTRLATALFLNKILAIFVGPAGYAVIGQFQNVVTMVTTFASGAVNTGVTKYTAEYYDDEERQRAIWRAAGTVTISGALLAAVLLVIFRQPLASLALKEQGLADVFLWLAAALVLFVLNGLLLAILNGKKEVGKYVAANISGSLIGAVSAALLASYYGLYGALVALSINQSLTFFVTFGLCRKTAWFEITNLFGRIDPDVARKLAGFTLVSATTAVVVPLSHILVRNHLGDLFGMQAAGYWQAIWKISELYLMLITTTLSLYYLPRLSEIRDTDELKREILQGYSYILPLAACGALAIFFLRDYIVSMLFTSDFSPMRDLFAWQLIGDVVKIASWLLGYVLIGRAMIKNIVATEIFFAISFYLLTLFLTSHIGLQGVTAAYLCNYVMHWCVMAYIVYNYTVNYKGAEDVR